MAMALPKTITATARAIAAGELTSRTATEAALGRVERDNASLGALLHVDAQGALARADQIDSQRRAGQPLGRLGGVPITLKDNISLVGMPMTAGSRILAGYRPPFDATVAARVSAAGAIVIGKCNLDEFAMGSSNETSAFGPVRNPHDLDRVPGGSSGGSAVAVAAGFGFGSLGSDTGGSIRLPAALCGVVGLKPTYGRVSRYGVVAFASSLDQVGPLATTSRDAARLLGVIAGPCRHDSTCADHSVPDFEAALGRESLAGIRVGVAREHLDGADGLDSAMSRRVRERLERLRDLGADLVDVELPHSHASIAAYYLIATAEASANLARYDGVRFGHRSAAHGGDLEQLIARSRGEGFGREVKRRIMLGTYALSSGYYDAYYRKACQVRRLVHDDFVAAFSHCDLLAGPVSPVTAWRLAEKTGDPLAMYLMDVFTTAVNLAGLPALSMPMPVSAGEMPAGLHLIGRAFDETTLLGVADCLERSDREPGEATP